MTHRPSSFSNTLAKGTTSAGLTALIVAQGLAATTAHDLTGADTETAKSGPAVKLDAVVIRDTKPKEVASPKFTEPLRDTPQTVVVIQSEVYLQQGAVSLSDVLRNTSGITFAAGEGGSAAGTSGDAV